VLTPTKEGKSKKKEGGQLLPSSFFNLESRRSRAAPRRIVRINLLNWPGNMAMFAWFYIPRCQKRGGMSCLFFRARSCFGCCFPA
jgi:hypothetical protein